jgi:KaiC/GvpD/RAD55 family RecA-like ATPase
MVGGVLGETKGNRIVTEQIGKFVACIFEPDDWIELRALQDGKAQKFWTPAASLTQQAEQLRKLNAEGFNIYAGPNPRKEKGQSGDDAVNLCRCLFADFDDVAGGAVITPADIVSAQIEEKGLPKPTLLINSGHGIHAYWRLSEPLEPVNWRQIQQRLNLTISSDPAIKNPERLMRLPGFKNVKAEPVDCSIVYAGPNLVYELADIVKHLARLPKPKSISTGTAAGKRPGAMEHKARAMLYAAKWPVIAEGQGRNNAAFAHACQLRRDFDLPDAAAWEILLQWNAGNNPPLSETELRQAFIGAEKYGKRPAGTKLDEPKPKSAKKREAESKPQHDPILEFDEYINDIESGVLRTIDWPWQKLSEGTQALQPGTVTILSGGPGAAKSLFMLQAVRYWIENGEQVIYYGMEGQRVKYQMRALAQLAGNSELTKTSYVKENAADVRLLRKRYAKELKAFSDCLVVAGDFQGDYLDQISAWIHEKAKQGIRLIVIDPITLALRAGKAWVADQRFVKSVSNTAQEFLCNVIFVSHPEKGVEDPSLQNLAGGASYGRFSDNVFTLKKHEDIKKDFIKTCMGRAEYEYDQTLAIAKAREGSSVGRRLAFRFSPASLTTEEIGYIVKEPKL